jgi:hypothetical protein
MPLRFIIVLCAAVAIVGCSTSSPFYWGDHAATDYAYRLKSDSATVKAHIVELKRIIDVASSYQKRIPPGVAAEYGFLLITQRGDSTGWRYLRRERDMFPESKPFIERLEQDLRKEGGRP